MKKKAYKVSLKPNKVSESIFIELEANSEFREHDKQIGFIEKDEVNLYGSRIDKEVLVDVVLAILEANEEVEVLIATKKEPVVEEAPF